MGDKLGVVDDLGFDVSPMRDGGLITRISEDGVHGGSSRKSYDGEAYRRRSGDAMKDLISGGKSGQMSSPLRLSIGGAVYEQLISKDASENEVISFKKLDSKVATPFRNVTEATETRTPPTAYPNLLNMVLSTTTPGGTEGLMGDNELNLMAPTPTTARKNPTGRTPAAHKTPGNTRRKKGMMLKAMSPDDWENLVGANLGSGNEIAANNTAKIAPKMCNFEPAITTSPPKPPSAGNKQRLSMSRLSMPKTPPSDAKKAIMDRRKSGEGNSGRGVFDRSSPSDLAKSIYMDTSSPSKGSRSRSGSMGTAGTPKRSSPAKGKKKVKKAVGFASPSKLSLAMPSPQVNSKRASYGDGGRSPYRGGASTPGGSPRAQLIQSATKELDKVWALINSSPMRNTPEKFTPRKGATPHLASRKQTPGMALRSTEEEEEEEGGSEEGTPAPIPLRGANFQDSPTEDVATMLLADVLANNGSATKAVSTAKGTSSRASPPSLGELLGRGSAPTQPSPVVAVAAKSSSSKKKKDNEEGHQQQQQSEKRRLSLGELLGRPIASPEAVAPVAAVASPAPQQQHRKAVGLRALLGGGGAARRVPADEADADTSSVAVSRTEDMNNKEEEEEDVDTDEEDRSNMQQKAEASVIFMRRRGKAAAAANKAGDDDSSDDDDQDATVALGDLLGKKTTTAVSKSANASTVSNVRNNSLTMDATIDITMMADKENNGASNTMHRHEIGLEVKLGDVGALLTESPIQPSISSSFSHSSARTRKGGDVLSSVPAPAPTTCRSFSKKGTPSKAMIEAAEQQLYSSPEKTAASIKMVTRSTSKSGGGNKEKAKTPGSTGRASRRQADTAKDLMSH
jgi:hypothetical protein